MKRLLTILSVLALLSITYGCKTPVIPSSFELRVEQTAYGPQVVAYRDGVVIPRGALGMKVVSRDASPGVEFSPGAEHAADVALLAGKPVNPPDPDNPMAAYDPTPALNALSAAAGKHAVLDTSSGLVTALDAPGTEITIIAEDLSTGDTASIPVTLDTVPLEGAYKLGNRSAVVNTGDKYEADEITLVFGAASLNAGTFTLAFHLAPATVEPVEGVDGLGGYEAVGDGTLRGIGSDAGILYDPATRMLSWVARDWAAIDGVAVAESTGASTSIDVAGMFDFPTLTTCALTTQNGILTFNKQ